ncbi:18106_t:CDS:2, partial [Gigaspora rosea]
MPRPKVKSRIASSKNRTKFGTFTTRSEVNAKESIDNAENALEWYQGVDRGLKFSFNTGNSRTNLWKKRKAQEQLQQEAKQIRTLKEMWSIKICNRKEAPLILHDNEHKEREDTITKEMARLQPYEMQRLSSVYIRNIDYMSYCIRGWAKDFLVQGSLSSHRQGKHSKRLSLLNDEDISLAARTWLRSASPKDRSPLSLKKELEAAIFSKLLGVPVTISETTVLKFMHLWGFRNRAIEQQVYFDGHEREDVKEYRKSWASRMINYRKKMDQYCGNEMEIVIPPEQLEIWDSRHVMVTHDEVYFYTNDDMLCVWLEDSESMIKKKGQGGSIIVSDFLCLCHGPLRLTEEDSIQLGLEQYTRVIIKPGNTRNSYWKSENMVRQLVEKAIPIFNFLYPRCIGMIQFTNHNAYALDALVCSRMTLNPKVEKDYNFKDGWFI